MAVGFVASRVTMTDQGLGTLTVRARSPPEFSHQAEELVMTEGKQVGEFESHSGIIPEVANQTPHYEMLCEVTTKAVTKTQVFHEQISPGVGLFKIC
jgi:hypothetical protein